VWREERVERIGFIVAVSVERGEGRGKWFHICGATPHKRVTT
jgi:hypothetical protein